MTKPDEQIAILMATYNGAAYLREQMDSILSQSATDWHLFVHDDNSADNTACILDEYAGQYPQKITRLHYPAQGGACRNFLSMLDTVKAPYYMFSDQDDVWLPEKVEKTFRRMKDLEAQCPDQPVIVHSDLMIVDETLRTLDASFVRNQQIKMGAIKSFEDYAATNTVTGCTMLFNQRARQCIKKPDDKALMHDAWICLSVAAQHGIIDFISEPLIKYRQHDSNTLGARDMDQQTLRHKLRHIRQQMNDDIRHYREMNAVRPLSVTDFIKAKLRYKKY